jgi:hypothetical protein
MKNKIIIISLFILTVLTSCHSSGDCSGVLTKINNEFIRGNLAYVKILADSVKESCPGQPVLIGKADSLAQIAERICLDFSLNEESAIKKIDEKLGSCTPDQMEEWEKKGWLEYRIIDGRKMYFKRAVSNLVLLKKFYEEKDIVRKENQQDQEMLARLKNTEEALRLSGDKTIPAEPVKIGITYTISVHTDIVPEGAKIRCWLPWPKSNHPRQKAPVLVSTSNPEYIISPDSAIHSTLYMEAAARKGVPTTFSITYNYQSSAQHFNLSDIKILPYNKESELYTKYTAEQLPQINFSGKIRQLADSLTGSEENPAEIVRKIYMWFKENIPWAGALEYSVMPDIPDYVLTHRRGDCGMQTLLYMSMLRYKGIPVRWQSGWMIPPAAENLHDWCEIYFEGAGWIPSDVSYDLQETNDKNLREYFLSGLDCYRLIVNDGISGNLYPGKTFYRSEPYDFQRGEVEWEGGNLYFDKWDYNIKIDYLK